MNEPSQNQRSYPPLSGAGMVLLFTSIPLVIFGALGTLTLAKWPMLIGELTLLIPALLYLRHYRFNYRIVLRFNPVSWRVTLLSMVIGAAVTILAIEFDHLVSLLLPFPDQWEVALQGALRADSTGDWIFILLAAVVLAGLFEEMLFRGFVQNTLEQRHEPLTAIFITAILFGAVHLNPWWFLQFIFIAMFLGILAWMSDSIIPGAIVHAQNNLIAVLLSNHPNGVLHNLLVENGHVHPALIVAAIPALYFGLRLLFRFCNEEQEIPTLLNTPIY